MTTTFDGLAIELTDVHKRFGKQKAVDGLTLAAKQGEVLALLGPNGAGKTTTIEMCEGFQTATSGKIRVLGLDPTTEAEQVRSRVGIMLQGGGGYSGASVIEQLHLAASYNKDPLDPELLIDLFGLSGVRKTTYRRLSGGQQQRLSLALALIGKPELVFLDEPTAGMDAQSRLAVWDVIRALRRDGVTIVLTTHLMDEAETLADAVAIMDRGRLVAHDSPDRLTTSDASQLTIVTDSPLDLSSVVGTAPTTDLRQRITTDVSPTLISAIAAAAEKQGVMIRELSSGRRTLEDVFLDLTGKHLRS